ncbi:MAG: response regulator [Defluviitaleaceae bacterium]|nr:response regulator [Defluviitaleaceae bacterium]
MEKLNILIVDDQPSVCKEISSFLRNEYTVHAFKSGEEALEYMSENHTDLVLLDYDMPEMTGYEVLLAMRLNPMTKKTPVIFLTAETNERMRYEMMGRGANDYLCKPVSATELHLCVKKHLL